MKRDKQASKDSGLSRQLGVFTATMVVVGSMIGSGVFKKITPMAITLQSSRLILLSWLLAGIVTILGALSVASISRVTIEAGGQYQYLKISYGKFFAFLYGWGGFTVIQSASIASIAYVFGQSINNVFPLPHLPAYYESIHFFGFIYPLDNLGVKLMTIGAIMFITMVNFFGVSYGGWLVNIFSSAKVLGIALFIGLAFFFSSGNLQNIWQPSVRAAHYSPTLFRYITGIFVAMLSAFWAYDGWANITSLSGEVKDCPRNLPIALIVGVFCVTAVYLVTNVAYLYVMPIDAFIEISKNKNAIAAAEAVNAIVGHSGYILISLLIMVSTFGAANSGAMSAPRVYYAMARDGLFFKGTANSHPKYKTPHRSLMIQCLWVSVLVMSGTFDQLTDMLVFAAFIFYGAVVFGLFVLKRKQIIRDKIFGYPYIPALFVIFCVILLVSTIIERPAESCAGLILIFSGIPVYLYWSRA